MESIAIVGIGCRFATAADPEAFFELLKNRVDATSEVPPDRWNLRTFYDPDRRIAGKVSTARGGFLRQVDAFDAAFFSISPREAACMDPQQRLVLEVSWEALEDAGIPPQLLAGTDVGVFMGAFTLDYKAIQLSPLNRHLMDAHTATGAMMTMISNRISYTFDFRGPSMSIDTACSSSLVAVHVACQSLRQGECSVALAGGVNVMTQPDYTIAESKGGFLAPDGRSKPFSAAADGYGRAEGAGVVVLKPLARAIADGDPIYAVIRGSAVNQDGHSNGITVPRGEAQEQLIRDACRRAGIAPRQIQYVEAHGTGTPVGDPIELGALAAALGDGRPADQPCIVGSVKGNIGHTEAGAGVAGLIKTAMSLQAREILPNIHFDVPNPAIPFDRLPVRVPVQVERWPESDGPALAGVNSFGFGGTNAHVILEEAPAPQQLGRRAAADTTSSAVVFPLSARSPQALKDAAQNMRDYAATAERRGVPFADMHYTAAQRRSHHGHRLAIVASSSEELASLLDAHLAGESRAGIASGVTPSSRRRLAFVCTGMGPQWWAMGRRLFAEEPIFRAAIVECDDVLRREANWSLLTELLADETRSRMAETVIAQTSNFAIQIGLAALWRSWGITPDAIVGHSVGEVSAAYLSGTLSLQDAVRVSFHRGRLQQTTAGSGAMMAVGLPADDLASMLPRFEGRLSIAAENSPSSTTISGDPAAIERLAAELASREVFHRALRVNVAYHSAQMDPLSGELHEALANLQPRAATVPLYSTVTGRRVDGRELTADYWWKNVRQSVEFRAAIDTLVDDGFDAFLEVGPHPVLASPMNECASARGRKIVSVCSLRRGDDERRSMLAALASLYTLGLPARWDALVDPSTRVVRLPAYPWQRERHWMESEASLADRIGVPVHPLLGRRSGVATPVWQLELSATLLPYLGDHAVAGAVVFPGAGYVEMALAAGKELFGAGEFAVEQIRFERALFLEPHERVETQVTLDAEEGRFAVLTRTGGQWARRATGRLQLGAGGASAVVHRAQVTARCRRELGREECYEQFGAQGFQYGPAFQKIERLWIGEGEALAAFENLNSDGEYRIHPTVLDACFQALVATNPFRDADGAPARHYVPVGIDRVRVRQQPQGRLWAWARLERRDSQRASGSISLFNESGQVVVEIEAFQVQALDTIQGALSREQIDRGLYSLSWVAAPPEGDDARPPRGAWLVLADAGGTAATLGQQLEAAGATVILAEPGQEYAFPEGNRCVLNPIVAEDYARLLADAARRSGGPLRGAVHLWSLDLRAGEAAQPADLDEAENVGCVSVMHLVQALARSGGSPRLWLVTRGAQAVVENDRPLVMQSALWGMGRVIGHQEHLGLWGGLIDLDPAAPAASVETLARELLQPGREDQVALRAGGRYVARLNRHAGLQAAAPVHLRPDASYLITGGFGALGLLTARWMVERGARRLILMGRNGVPPRSEWQADHRPDTRARIDAIRELEALGATVACAAVDVADGESLGRFLQQYAREAWPPIRGVVHAAGVVRDQLLLQMDAASFTSVLRPKVRGAWNLHRQLADAPLDFFVLYSSIGSLVAAAGQANYAAGNAFLDALAAYRRQNGQPALSINWGPWAVGMVSDLNLVDHYAARGLDVIAPKQGMQFLARLLGQPVAQAAVLSANWTKFFDFQPRVIPMLAHLADAADGGAPAGDGDQQEDFLTALLMVDGDARATLLQERLRDLVARVVRMDGAKIELSESLNVLGLDSMMATDLKNRIELDLHVSVPLMDLLKGMTIGELAAGLLPRLVEENADLQELLDELEQAAAAEASGSLAATA